MTLERLMKSNAFKKLLEVRLTLPKSELLLFMGEKLTSSNFQTWQQEAPQNHITLLDILKAPIQRMKYYAPALRVLAQNTDPLHPDYAHMLRCTAKFESLNMDMTGR
jgi:RhoGEF domain